MSDELKMIFDTIQTRLDNMDKKLDSLTAFKWKVVGISIGINSILLLIATIWLNKGV